MAFGQRGIDIARQGAGPGDVGRHGGAAQLGVIVAADAVGQHMGDRRAVLVMFESPGDGAEAAGHGRGVDDQQDGQAQYSRQFGGIRFAVVQTHHAFDENQVGGFGGAGEAAPRVVFAAHAQVDVLARCAAGQRMDLRIEEVRPALEDAHAAPQARV